MVAHLRESAKRVGLSSGRRPPCRAAVGRLYLDRLGEQRAILGVAKEAMVAHPAVPREQPTELLWRQQLLLHLLAKPARVEGP